MFALALLADRAGLETVTAAIELAPKNITVNAVLPGNIMTEGLEGNGPDYIAAMEASVPLKRLGTPEEIASIVGWLVSDQAGFSTGANFACNGGLYMT